MGGLWLLIYEFRGLQKRRGIALRNFVLLISISKVKPYLYYLIMGQNVYVFLIDGESEAKSQFSRAGKASRAAAYAACNKLWRFEAYYLIILQFDHNFITLPHYA